MHFLKILFASILTFLIFSASLKADATFIQSNNLYLKYTSYPELVYSQQRFTVKLEAIILIDVDEYTDIVTTLYDEKNIELSKQEIVWIEKAEGEGYTANITFKAYNKAFTLPTIKLTIMEDDEEVDSVSANPPEIKIHKIAINQDKFSQIIADKLEIRSVKTKQLNNEMLMSTIHIEAINGNLEEFYLKKFKEQNIIEFDNNYLSQSLYYSVVFPKYIKEINFDYYNPILAEFINVQLPIFLEEDLVSTQTDLNPYDNSMLLYKQIALFVLILIFVLIYLKNRSKLAITFAILFAIPWISLMLPNSIIDISKGTKVYILPTTTSTVYKILEKRQEVEVLIKQEKFIKVLFQNKHIGWIKRNDI